LSATCHSIAYQQGNTTTKLSTVKDGQEKKKHIFVRRCNVMHERRLKKKNNMIKENIPSLEEMYNSRTVGTGKITYEFNKPTMS
jgi:hypothetical protein